MLTAKLSGRDTVIEGSTITSGIPVLRVATEPDDYAAFADVCRDYMAWCRRRYGDMPWFVDEVFGHQDIDEELSNLSAKYGPPAGRTLIAVTPDGVVAGGAWTRRSASVCELKRLFVTDRARGRGLGRRLTEGLIASATAEGFETMRLDTADRLVEAIAMYASMGFETVAPFHDYPERLMRHVIFMAKAL